MINIYSNNNQSALKYLMNTKANIQNVLIMAGDFNIRDSSWYSLYPFYLSHSITLLEIVDFFDLSLFSPIQQVLIHYLDNNNDTNSVLDLFFLQSSSMELNNHNIFPEL